MSHRMYLYNIAVPGEARNDDKMMMEWGYEMPLLLQPLLASNGFAAANIYNNDAAQDNNGLYFEAKGGIENMKRFYLFLERQEGLIENREQFSTAKENLFDYLDNLQQEYFHLDTWDVFNMRDTPHEEQAQTLMANIAHNNLIFSRAMEEDDFSIIEYQQLMDTSHAFNSFKDLLNYENYNYGWECIWQEYQDPGEVTFFEENGKWGFKDINGNVLAAPQFDELYGFSADDYAVAYNKGRYGYVDKAGKLFIPLMYDDAFDFENGKAIVKLGNKYGLIDAQNNTVMPFEFDDMQTLDHGYCCIMKEEKWGIADGSGNIVLPMQYDGKPESHFEYYSIPVQGSRNRIIINWFFKQLGIFPLSAIATVKDHFILVKPYKGNNQQLLFKKCGILWEQGFEKIGRPDNLPNVLILRKNKKYGALGLQQEAILLPYEYSSIRDLEVIVEGRTTNFVLAVTENSKGIFDGDETAPGWLFEPGEYEDIRWLHALYFAFKLNGLWAISVPGKWISDFEFDDISRKPAINSFAYAFTGDEVFVIATSGIYIADKTAVLEDAEDRYTDYYFGAAIRKRLKKYAAL